MVRAAAAASAGEEVAPAAAAAATPNGSAGQAAKQAPPAGTLWGAISLITGASGATPLSLPLLHCSSLCGPALLACRVCKWQVHAARMPTCTCLPCFPNAGSTVGAGMLALPAVSAPAGIAPTSAALVGIWVLLTVDALLIAEVNLAARTARDAAAAAAADNGSGGAAPAGDVVTLRQMAEFSLGKAAGRGLTLVYLALAYSLLTAYATKAAEVSFAGGSLEMERWDGGSLGVACHVSPPLSQLRTHTTQQLNRLCAACFPPGAGLPCRWRSSAAPAGSSLCGRHWQPAVPGRHPHHRCHQPGGWWCCY